MARRADRWLPAKPSPTGAPLKDRTASRARDGAFRRPQAAPGSPDHRVSPPTAQIGKPPDPLERRSLLGIALQRQGLTPAFGREATSPRIRDPNLHWPKTGSAQRAPMSRYPLRTIRMIVRHVRTNRPVTCNILRLPHDVCDPEIRCESVILLEHRLESGEVQIASASAPSSAWPAFLQIGSGQRFLNRSMFSRRKVRRLGDLTSAA